METEQYAFKRGDMVVATKPNLDVGDPPPGSIGVVLGHDSTHPIYYFVQFFCEPSEKWSATQPGRAMMEREIELVTETN